MTSLADFSDWLVDCARPDAVWYAKRLSANDTLATGGHQAGPYIPRRLLFRLFPTLNRPELENPDVRFRVAIDSHGDERMARAVWYNNKLRGGTRNETRLTGFGGARSPLLDPENTGALTVFAFLNSAGEAAPECRIWVCQSVGEEELAEDRLGPVEPGKFVLRAPGAGFTPDLFAIARTSETTCRIPPERIPSDWLESFPDGRQIVRKSVEFRPALGEDPDTRLVRRRECEYEIFLSVEEAVELPGIRDGFRSIDEFVSRAQSILQRRKARSGRSLELHAREILIEEGFREGEDFSHGVESEPGRRPDFLFPAQARYAEPAFPEERLRMLAVKTTCRDRWRQILNEAARIRTKHLLTLQEGVSENQFREMTQSGVRLVVPTPLLQCYPAAIRKELVTFGAFIRSVRDLRA